MKKIGLALLLTVGLLATAVGAYAAPNVVGPTNTGDIDIEIHLGFDPSTEGPTPPNPDEWIAVQIPTRVLIFSDGSATPAHSTFVPVDHTIRNFSSRGVRIDIASFENTTPLPTFEPIDLLTINSYPNGVDYNLIDSNGFATITTGWELMTLPSSLDGTTNYTSGTFNFTGDIDVAALGTTTSQANAELTLRLRPLDSANLPY